GGLRERLVAALVDRQVAREERESLTARDARVEQNLLVDLPLGLEGKHLRQRRQVLPLQRLLHGARQAHLLLVAGRLLAGDQLDRRLRGRRGGGSRRGRGGQRLQRRGRRDRLFLEVECLRRRLRR